MKQISLNGAWNLEIPGSNFGLMPACVPDSVYHDLLTDKKIPNPFYRDNESEALKLMESDFHYSHTVQVDAGLLVCDMVLLRCEGLDTLVDIFINGTTAGRANNMHHAWEFDVKGLLHEGENLVEVHFSSPAKHIKESYALSPADGFSDVIQGFPNLRKAHCSAVCF